MIAMVRLTSRIVMISILLSLLSLASAHDVILDGTTQGLSASGESVDHSNDAPGADKCEVCHIFQHMDVPAPQLARAFFGEACVSPGRAADAESLAHTPDGPPPQDLIA